MASEEGTSSTPPSMVPPMSRETQMSIEASSMFPGFRFSPTDVELISYYLRKKLEGAQKFVEVIPEIDICSYEAWDLPAKSIIQSDCEWFFFSPRGRKYPNGTQSKRATELGYWKATGKERDVKSGSDVIGTKRTLVFHVGRAPKGERTEWIMHEYCLNGMPQDSLVVCRLRKNIDFRPNESSSRTSQIQGASVPAHNSSNIAPEAGVDRAGTAEGDRATVCSKKSSSYDSFSIEQFDSASESEQKQSNEVNVAESSGLHKDSDNDEDFYADILKDDIVKLDETSLSSVPALSMGAMRTFDVMTELQQPLELLVAQTLPAIPIQGTANRRVKLKVSSLAEPPNPEESSSRSPGSSSCVVGSLGSAVSKRKRTSIVLAVLALLALLLSWIVRPDGVNRNACHSVKSFLAQNVRKVWIGKL